MSIELISIKCPECGATLSIEENREQAYYTYCGTKILLHNEKEYVYRHIDEAEITAAETDRMIRLKELELKETELKKEEQLRFLKIKISLAAIVLGVLMLLFGNIFGKMSGDSNSTWYICAILGMFCLMFGGAGLIFSLTKDNSEDKK